MRRLAGLVALGILTAMPTSTAWAQRGGRGGGPVKTADGVLYDTRSPEWKQAGGNLAVYQQIMQQKMLMEQQKQMVKYEQEMLKQQKQYEALQKAGKLPMPSANLTPTVLPTKKKRRTYVPQGTALKHGDFSALATHAATGAVEAGAGAASNPATVAHAKTSKP